MKATGSRGRSPQRRDQYRDVDDYGSAKKRTVQQQPVEVVGREYDGSSGESDIRSGGDKRINDDNVNIGCAPEILLADSVHQAEQSMAKDLMGKSTLDEVLRPSIVGLNASDGPTNASNAKRPQDVDKQHGFSIVRLQLESKSERLRVDGGITVKLSERVVGFGFGSGSREHTGELRGLRVSLLDSTEDLQSREAELCILRCCVVELCVEGEVTD
nr:hypothetical protein CFP56_47638 [Quercus suber]